MTKAKIEMTTVELLKLRDEYFRMLSIAQDNNWLSQEFRLGDMIEEIDNILEERVDD